jgi:RimJ/RimL family protein N-acetyltransferase
MHLHWLDPTSLDRRDVDAVAAVWEMSRAADAPGDRASTALSVRATLKYGWDLNPAQTAVFRDARGRAVGVLDLHVSRYDNRHVADVGVTVDPSARRRGIGRRLFEIGVERAVADGRTLITAHCRDGGPGMGFAKAMGLDRASEEVRRAQDLWSLDGDRIDGLAAEAAGHHADYEIVPIGYPTPEEMLEPIAVLTAAINDAPTDDLDVEDEVFTPERMRALEQSQFAYDHRMYRLVARHRDTGELAGQTIVVVPALQPWFAYQLDTSVVRGHRGHRLGLALKIAMLRGLAQAEPQVRTLETWNAASNEHMIGINEALGYRVVSRAIDWQKHL